MALALLIYFVFKTVFHTNKIKKRMRVANEFAQPIRNGTTKIFYCTINPKVVLDNDGNIFPILENEQIEIVYKGLCAGSSIPTDGYRLTIGDIHLKQHPWGETSPSAPIIIELEPMNGSVDNWTYKGRNYDARSIFAHPIMGDLILPTTKIFTIGKEYCLQQIATEQGNNCVISFDY